MNLSVAKDIKDHNGSHVEIRCGVSASPAVLSHATFMERAGVPCPVSRVKVSLCGSSHVLKVRLHFCALVRALFPSHLGGRFGLPAGPAPCRRRVVSPRDVMEQTNTTNSILVFRLLCIYFNLFVWLGSTSEDQLLSLNCYLTF